LVLLLLVIGYIGVFFGRLIQAAVSRQREFLADASSVQFTRNPQGITGALKKIGGLGETGSRLSHAHAEELIAHVFRQRRQRTVHRPARNAPTAHQTAFASSTRISTDNFPSSATTAATGRLKKFSNPDGSRCKTFSARWSAAQSSLRADAGRNRRSSGRIPSCQISATPTPLHLEYAEQLRDSLPDSVKAAAREPLDAIALIYAMLLSPDETMRTTQLAELAKRVAPAIQQKTAALFPDVSQAAAHAHLPMINLALGTLRHLTAEQYTQFSQTLEWLIGSDGKIELFEFVLQKIILHHLGPQFGQTPRTVVQYYSIKPLVPDCAVLLSALANVSSSDAGEIKRAFEVGTPYLRAPDDGDLVLLPREQCGVDQIDTALNRMAQASPLIKKNLLEACIHTVGADGVILEAEAELLRAIADTLDCPMPPFVPAE
jgi:uncharacterized tellurite resistance protein B-like protein